jgi:hypothetical protein
MVDLTDFTWTEFGIFGSTASREDVVKAFGDLNGTGGLAGLDPLAHGSRVVFVNDRKVVVLAEDTFEVLSMRTVVGTSAAVLTQLPGRVGFTVTE